MNPLDFDAFVVLMGYKTIELDPEDVLLEAWSKFDDHGTGCVNAERYNQLKNKKNFNGFVSVRIDFIFYIVFFFLTFYYNVNRMHFSIIINMINRRFGGEMLLLSFRVTEFFFVGKIRNLVYTFFILLNL